MHEYKENWAAITAHFYGLCCEIRTHIVIARFSFFQDDNLLKISLTNSTFSEKNITERNPRTAEGSYTYQHERSSWKKGPAYSESVTGLQQGNSEKNSGYSLIVGPAYLTYLG